MSLKDHSSDSNLINGLKRENHDSFRLLFEFYSKPLFQFSVSYLIYNDAAEDVVQEVFYKSWSNRKVLKPTLLLIEPKSHGVPGISIILLKKCR